MTQAIISQGQSDIMEQVIIKGDLSQLSPAERVNYYRAVCESIGLNPLTKPFDYIDLDGKLTLYAKRDATDQLRKIHSISVTIAGREKIEDVYIVTAKATTPDGRSDEATGVVSISKEDGEWKTAQSGKRYFAGNGTFKPLHCDALANALMKAETKAKRRVTLSLCGLGWLDETEVETIPDAKQVIVTETGNLGQQWTEQPAEPAKTTQPTYTNGAAEWPSKLLNSLVMHYKGGTVQEYRARLGKSTMLKPTDGVAVVIHWMDIYNTERGTGVDSDEAAKRADADRQATTESA